MTEYKDKWCQEAYNKGFKEGRDFEKGQLVKAKEFIKLLLMNCVGVYESTGKTIAEIQAEAKQFLKNDGCPDVMCEDCTKEDCGTRQLGLVGKVK